MRPSAPPFASLSLALLVLAAACAHRAASRAGEGPSPAANLSAGAPNPDPRVGLHAGLTNAGEASWNLRLLSNTPKPGKFAEEINSDLAFTGNYVIQGNYNGYQVWDISDPKHPTLRVGFVCPA
jgi:hypothetical protein